MRTASPAEGRLEPVPLPPPAITHSASPAPSAPGRVVTLPLNEPTLEARAMEGDVAAWNALVNTHNHRVVVSLLAHGVRLDRAKDLAQDAWLRLVEQQREGKLSHLRLPGLAIIQAGFLAREAARGARRAELRGDAGLAAKVADPQANAETKLLAEEQLSRAEQVLSQCSPSARTVFLLVYGGEGLSHAEAAARVGLSLQRVRQIVCEVRKVLRTKVEVEGVDPS
jgi:RNA polymerase sigma factor (sigma-70 family)